MTTQTSDEPASPAKPDRAQRRYDMDWLRVLAVLLLLPFHTARIFDTFSTWYVKNDSLSDALTYFIFLVHPWHMPLLFLLAGASTWFALGYRSGGRYAKERVVRLLVPFVFGVLVVVPPQSYFGMRGHTGYSGSYLEWYPSFFSINTADLDGYFLGGFTPAHLWFIIYLFIFSLLALPLFLYLRGRDSGKRITRWLASFCALPGAILLFAIPLYASYAALDFYPSPLYFIAYFVLGFLLVSDSRFEEAVDRHKAVAFALGIPYLLLGFSVVTGQQSDNPAWLDALLHAYVVGFAPWFFVIAILGYGRRILSTSNRFLRYMGPASYPYYILHQTVIVVIGFYVVGWAAGVGVKYLVILAAATAATALLYEVVIKRFNPVRFLFGMRPQKQ